MVVQVSSRTYEERTQVLAQQLLAASKPERSFLGQMWEQMRWDDRLLSWAMESERLRVPLFRLIDVLPALRTKTEVARHLQEYLGQANVDLPGLLKNLVNFSQPDSLPGQLAASTLTSAVETLAHRYIAGATLKQVSKTLEGLRKQNMAFTLDLLGEAVITEAEAEGYLQKYLETMTFLAEAAHGWSAVPGLDATEDGVTLPRVQVSVKLTAFYSQFDPLNERGSQERVSERIRRLLRRAAELGVAVHFDMEQYAYKALTLSILKDLLCEEEFQHRADIGMTLQAYLRDSYQDLVDLVNWAKQRQTPITVRLVKGAYWDQETILALQKHWPQPVFNEKSVTDANFERMTQLLLEHHHVLYAAIGSHNIRSQAKALAIAEGLKVPKRAFELQVLYGMADRLATALVQTGQRVRVYCPYGELLPGMAYLIRRLLENTANSSFLRQSLVGTPTEALLAPPSAIEKEPLRYPQAGFAGVPDTDFSAPDQSEPFFVALERVRQTLGLTYRPLINGQFIETEDLLDSVNPSHPIELVGRVGLVNIDHAQEAIQSAQAAFLSWRRTPVPQRAQLIRKVADLVQERRQDLAAWMVLEVGKPLRQVDGEISE
ncbi:MAG: bifunctional proline dehydrogenase/L-glutamate gamma-semialdehyde dehydrogenase, partial [Synechococcaceae cyanobacterium SM2_3_1]|nr:bifunctional proline dehydrogenase/L-glutamate gamma-semialdehyde dehydrogenase [Synechococcaceae cyanobacterium SM2_3_1]